uniref:Ubiquitin-protein ligase n=1 Tax=Solanum tuberosum TaxID=4113 RepID=M1DJC1_SOLTU
MSKKKSTNSVPCDILVCILTRLPVKSLLRFQSVSTSWNAIISTYEFKKTILDQSNALGRVKCLSSQGCSWDEFKFINLEYPNVTIEGKEFPLKGFENANVLCSYNGLVLLKNPRAYKKFILWNPSTRQCQELASCSHVKKYVFPRACGLCYDSTTDDCKVILIYNSFYVVCSNGNYWRKQTNLPILNQVLPTIEQETKFCSYEWAEGVNVEGCVYWSLHRKLRKFDLNVSRNSTIIYFDVKSDELKILPKPNFIRSNDEWFRLTNVKDCLSLYGGMASSDNFDLDIWTMDVDGWKWLMKLCNVPTICCKHYFITHTKFLCCKENGELIFVGPGHQNVSIYNPKQQQFVKKEYLYCDATCFDSLCFPKINVMMNKRNKRKRK